MGESERARNDRCGNGDVDPGRRRERIGSGPRAPAVGRRKRCSCPYRALVQRLSTRGTGSSDVRCGAASLDSSPYVSRVWLDP